MKPLELRELASCCGAAIICWDRIKHEFICPCGKLRCDMDGRPLRVKINKAGRKSVSRELYDGKRWKKD